MLSHRIPLSLLTGLLLIAALVPASAGAQPTAGDCGRVFVSGYQSTVHVYDACTGEFQRKLAERSRLAGAQAVREHEGRIHVIAEERGKVVRFDADTLEDLGDFINSSVQTGITGLDFAADGSIYVGGYNSGSVNRHSGETGAYLDTAATDIGGPDNGLVFGPDGQLYIPAFDDDSVMRWNPATGQLSTFIASGSGGLRNTRGVLFEPTGGVLISSEGSDQILRFRTDGSFDRVLASVPRPTGMAYGPQGELLVASYGRGQVLRLDANSGAELGALFAPGSGGLMGATFVMYQAPAEVDEENEPDLAQIGSQYWITGLATVEQRRIALEMTSSNGALFGAAFDPAAIATRRWGTLELEFIGCDAAEMEWDSTGTDSAGFGRGGYTLQRLVGTRASARCNQQGMEAMEHSDWMTGTWYGGAGRSGEGLMIDVAANGVVFVAFYTHRPELP